MGGSDSVREKGIEYVSVSLMDMRHKLFIPSLENEQVPRGTGQKGQFFILRIKFMHFSEHKPSQAFCR